MHGRVQRLATDQRLQMRVLLAVEALLDLALDKDGESLCVCSRLVDDWRDTGAEWADTRQRERDT